jgi:DNA polymerase-3 subunit epsilon
MWQVLPGKDFGRRRALQRTPAGPLYDYLAVPFPARASLCRDTEIVSLDLETTGLDPASDRILSIGTVTVRGMAVRLDTAWHQLVQASRDIPEASAVIHRITDDQSAQGLPLKQVIPDLLDRLTGKVVLVHHAAIEQQFIDQACRTLYGSGFLAPMIDTEVLARRQFERCNRPYRPGDLRLSSLREHYQLPRYLAHNALSDALATAELYLAISAGMATDNSVRLKDVLC